MKEEKTGWDVEMADENASVEADAERARKHIRIILAACIAGMLLPLLLFYLLRP